MKILLLGKDGQVGWELQRALSPLGDVTACGRCEADLEDPAGLRARIHSVRPDVVVNAAAYTAVDRAEAEPERARAINAAGVRVIAEETRAVGAWLVHYSTDYVFDGEKQGRYSETDATGPLNVYGATKLDGERAIAACGGRHLVLRTSWVYATRGNNFAKTMLRLAGERNELKVVSDQVGAPTSAELIADVTALCLYRIAGDARVAERASGIYHLAAAGETSWHEYAQFVLQEARRLGMQLAATPEQVHPIPTTAYPTPARRPLNSRLDTRKLVEAFDLNLPHWQVHVRRLIAEITR